MGVQEGEEAASTRVGNQRNVIVGTATLGASHPPGAIKRRAMELRDETRVDAHTVTVSVWITRRVKTDRW